MSRNFQVNIDVWQNSPHSHRVFGLLLSPKPFKNSQIWSHWIPQVKMQVEQEKTRQDRASYATWQIGQDHLHRDFLLRRLFRRSTNRRFCFVRSFQQVGSDWARGRCMPLVVGLRWRFLVHKTQASYCFSRTNLKTSYFQSDTFTRAFRLDKNAVCFVRIVNVPILKTILL